MSPQDPDRPRGDARRTALLDSTLAIVGELGADAVTHRRVAQRAGLPLASTTYWFASKEALLTEALRRAAELDVARLRAAARAAAPTPAGIVAALLGPGSERATLITTYALMLEAARRPALQAISQAWTDAYLEVLAPLLTRVGSRRALDDARLLVAGADGLLIDRLAAGPGSGAGADPAPELTRLLGALLAESGR